MAVSQNLYVTEHSKNEVANTSVVHVLWQSRQSGDSYNSYTRTAYYYISINGGPETAYSVSYTLPKNSTKTIVDSFFTVEHKGDGSGSVAVRTYMDTGIGAGVVEKSASLTLTKFVTASTIDSAANVTLGNACSVKWTPKSAGFSYKLNFSLGSWNYTTGAIHPNQTSAYTYSGYTIPLEVAYQILSGFTGVMTVTLYTYSDSAATTQIGTADSETFTVTVPTSEAPAVSMSLAPVHSLPAAFNGIYVQGLSKVRANLSAEPKYNARIVYYDMTVSGKTYGVYEDYTSEYLTNPGTIPVIGHAEDSRQYGGYIESSITVIPYAKPKIQNVTAKRCDVNGNLSDAGTYLKIAATRSYYPVVSNGVQKNFCQIRYRYKVEGEQFYSDWATILAGNALSSDSVVTGPLLSGNLAATTTYRVEVQAIDDVGNVASSEIIVPTDKVYWHRDGVNNALGLGKYNEQENAVDTAWDFYMNNHRITGLAMPVDDTDAVPKAYAAPADIKMRKSLNVAGWYKIGKIIGNMCAVITFTIGGVFQYNQVMPSVVDIATYYSGARIDVKLHTWVENQLFKIGVIMETPLEFGVYVYYNSSQENPVDIVIHPSMGAFQSVDWIASNISEGDMMTVVSLLQ